MPRRQITTRIEVYLKSTIMWLQTNGLMPMVVTDWLMRTFHLEAV